MPKSKPSQKSAKKKKKTGQPPPRAGKKGSGGQRTLLNNRAFPRTYFSTEKGAEGEMVIAGKEVLAEVSTSANFFPVVNQSISPLNNSLFPKLSAIAASFEQFRFRKLRFHYVTGAPATLSGSVMHYVDYDLNDAPAPTAITLLANQTAMVSSVALDNVIDYDVSRQMLPKMFTGSNNAISLGSARESFIGFYRMFMDKGPSTTAFAGYIYAEYVCCLWTPKPPTPSGGVASPNPTLTTLAAGSTNLLPLPVINDQVGLPGQVATNPTSAYSAAGGIIGALDYARNVYEAGQWLLEAYGSLSAASMVDDNTSVKSLATYRSGRSVREDFEYLAFERKEVQPSTQTMFYKGKKVLGVNRKGDYPECCWTGTVQMDMNVPAERIRPLRGPLASGDVTLAIQWYDVSNGVIDPDFPASATGMTLVAQSSVLYSSGTGALSPNIASPMVVPSGKKYIVRTYLQLGVTTGRTLQNFYFGSSANGVSDI